MNEQLQQNDDLSIRTGVKAGDDNGQMGSGNAAGGGGLGSGNAAGGGVLGSGN
jgi:hypothetical protein